MKNLYFLKRSFAKAFMTLIMLSMVVGLSAQTTDGLVIHYTFETLENDTLIADATGNGNYAVVHDGATVGVASDGSGRNILALNGSNYATVGSEGVVSKASETLGSLTDYSIAVWAKLDAHNKWNRIFDFGANTDYYMFLTPSVETKGTPRYAIKDGSAEQLVSGTEALPLDEWIHFAVTCGDGITRLYINGKVVSELEFTSFPSNVIGKDNFTFNYLGKSQWPDELLAGSISDFRVYNRDLSQVEIDGLNGISEQLIIAKQDIENQMAAMDLNILESDITLPTASGDVKVEWETSNAEVITAEGVITQDEKYNSAAILTAILSYQNDTLRTTFTVIVLPATLGEELVVQFLFDDDLVESVTSDSVTVADLSENAWIGSLENEATILSYGETDPINVLYTGEGTGYLDMGDEIGLALSSLSEYTIGCYYRIDSDYGNLTSPGNFLWTMANTDNMKDEHLGGLYMILKDQDLNYRITETFFEKDNGVFADANFELGTWHHVAYSQVGGTGYIFLDGEKVASGAVGFTPALGVKKDTIPGTIHNFLGRACYASDTYLQKTMMYDFRVYNVGISEEDAPYVFGNEDKDWYEVADVLAALNLAVEEGVNLPTTLQDETDALDLGDLSAVTENITLPTVGTIDDDISIVWKTSNSYWVSAEGVVTRPELVTGNADVSVNVTLTATLKLGLNTLTKSFDVKVLAKEGTAYTDDLLINFNFSEALTDTVEVNDTTTAIMVTDASEQAFVGTIMNNAEILDMKGPDATYNLLYLENDSAYFDMGQEVGKVIYGLGNHYSTSIWYYVLGEKENLKENGNFAYAFANSPTSDVERNGYMFGRVYSNEHTVSEFYWEQGNQDVRNDTMQTDQGYWHHYAYVQNDTMGVVYIDGDTMSVETMTNYPGIVLPKDTLDGTIANYLGRPNFSSDNYLGKALLSDFRLYGKSLSYEEITEIYSISEDMEYAMLLDPPFVVGNKEISAAPSTVKIYSPSKGEIKVIGKDRNEKVYVYNVTGRLVSVSTSNKLQVNSGLHIVKVGSEAFKVVVR